MSAALSTAKIKGVASLPPDLRQLAPRLIARLGRDGSHVRLEQLYRWGAGEMLRGDEVRALLVALIADGKASKSLPGKDPLQVRDADTVCLTDKGQQVLDAQKAPPKPELKIVPPPQPPPPVEEEDDDPGDPADDDGAEDDPAAAYDDDPADDEGAEDDEREAGCCDDSRPAHLTEPATSRKLRSADEVRVLVLDALGQEPVSAARVADVTDLPPTTVQSKLKALVKEGAVERAGSGYRLLCKDGEPPKDRRGENQTDKRHASEAAVLTSLGHGELRFNQLADATAIPHSTLSRTLRHLTDVGKIRKTDGGAYALAGAAPVAQAPAADRKADVSSEPSQVSAELTPAPTPPIEVTRKASRNAAVTPEPPPPPVDVTPASRPEPDALPPLVPAAATPAPPPERRPRPTHYVESDPKNIVLMALMSFTAAQWTTVKVAVDELHAAAERVSQAQTEKQRAFDRLSAALDGNAPELPAAPAPQAAAAPQPPPTPRPAPPALPRLSPAPAKVLAFLKKKSLRGAVPFRTLRDELDMPNGTISGSLSTLRGLGLAELTAFGWKAVRA